MKIVPKIVNLKNKKKHDSSIYNVFVMFYYEICGFTKILRMKICFLNMYSVHAARILADNSRVFSFMPEQV